MATITVGTRTTTNLTGLQFPSFSATTFSDADIATIAALIVNDKEPGLFSPGAFSRSGVLYVPNRGYLTMQPGDVVAVTPNGWPILLSDIAIATTAQLTGTPINGTNTMVMTASAIVAGWQVGGLVAGTNIPVGTTITNISADGLTVTLSAVATGSPGAVTVTYGSFIHS